jgi:hypothetical protein
MMRQGWDGPAPTLRKGKDLSAGIRRVHGDVERAKAPRAAIERAPLRYRMRNHGSHVYRATCRAWPSRSDGSNPYANEITFPTETPRVEMHNVQGQGVPVEFVR